MSSKSLHIDKRITSLELTGGKECNFQQLSSAPDLIVYGGAHISKASCFDDLILFKKDVTIQGNLTTFQDSYLPNIYGDTITPLADCLTVNGNLCVNENTLLKGDLTVLGNIGGNITFTLPDTLNVRSINVFDSATMNDVCISGNLLVENVSVVLLETYQGNTAVWIEPASGLLPMTIYVDKLPCSGVIATIDSMNGNILYVPINSNPTPEIDVFKYHGLNSKGFTTNVTQLICTQQIQLVPPFLQNICLNRAPLSNFVDPISSIGSYSQAYGSITGSSIQGTFPIDWNTLTITSITSYTQNKSGVKDCIQWLLVPPVFGTNTSSALIGPGIPIGGSSIQFTNSLGATFTFDVVHDNAGGVSLNYVISGSNGVFDSDFVFSVGVQVSDIYGNLSNIAPMFIEESSAGTRYLRLWLDDTHATTYPSLSGRAFPGLTKIEAYDDKQELNITATSGTIRLGALVTGGGVAANTYLVQQLTGAPGGTGNYLLNRQQTSSITPTGLNMARVMPLPVSAWTAGPVANQVYSNISGGNGSGDSWYVSFSYAVFTGGGGVSARTKDYTAISPWTGPITFDYAYVFFPEYFANTTSCAILNNGVATPVGPILGGGEYRHVYGTITLNVVAGQSFGVRFGGGNFDATSRICGAMVLSNFIVPSSPAPLTITSNLVGTGFTDFAVSTAGTTQTPAQLKPDCCGSMIQNISFGLPTTDPNIGGWPAGVNSGPFPYPVIFDFGVGRTVKQIRVTNNAVGGGTGGARNIRFEISTNGMTWTPVVGVTTLDINDWLKRYVFNI
jgi:hypothetical protein